MPWPKTGATRYHDCYLQTKIVHSKGWLSALWLKSRDLYLVNGLALGFYQLFFEALFVCLIKIILDL